MKSDNYRDNGTYDENNLYEKDLYENDLYENIKADIYSDMKKEIYTDIKSDIYEEIKRDMDKQYLKQVFDGGQDIAPKPEKRKTSGFLKIYSAVVTVAAITACVMCIGLYYGKRKDDKASGSAVTGIGASEAVSASKSELSSLASDGGEDGTVIIDTDKNYFIKEEYTAADLKPLIKSYMTNNEGTLKMLRKIFPEEIVVFHGNRYMFIPIIDSIEKNDIDNNKIKKADNGEITYVENDKVCSHKGIDVSRFQENIDWDKVKKSGVEYAIVRVGYRGYGTGAMVEDEYAKKNIEGALKAGIKVGVYFFSEAITIEEAVEEAEFVLNMIKDYDITYPVYFDTEDIPNDAERTDSLSVGERTEIAIAFCEHVRKAGYTPGIYANLKWYTMSLDMAKLEKYDKWFAYYDEDLYFPYKITMWQYSENGSIDGITGGVDMNISFME